ncbi:MAG: ABC transporter ATP-binding protein [Thermoanaerobaculia bacterium]
MISARNLTFSYPNTTAPAVRGLDFSVERGEIFGFLGPNGAGKSTTQKILIRLLSEFEGEVEVFGRDLRGWANDYYEQVGVSFELPNHYLKLSAVENLTYFRALYAGKTRGPEELLGLVGLGRDGEVPVSQFSKGMKTRLSIARSLLNDPELIFLDEPTTGLDPVGARELKELIIAQKTVGKTVFLTTHDMTVADELCDRVAFIVDGRIELIDAPRNLKLEHGQHRVRLEFLRDGRTERREFPLEGLGENSSFLEVLRTQDVQTLHTLEASLEDVFIKVTGRELE